MYKELNRLATFSECQEYSNLNPLRLARDGFYYSRSSNEIICSSCDVRISRWSEQNNDPLEQHQRLSPNCALITGTETRNIPLTPLNVTLEPPRGAPELGAQCGNASPYSMDNVFRSALNRANAKQLLPSNSTYRIDPSNPDFVQLRHESVRLGTFDDWPSTANASPTVLAREGLFYTGIDDRVQCVFCRGFLKRWQPVDVPSEEHSKYFPACPFVRGLDFGNVPSSGSSIAGIAKTLVAGDQRPLTRPEYFNLEDHSQASRQPEAPQTMDQGVSGSDRHVSEMMNLEARMSAAGVRVVLDMGFSRDLVKRTIENKLSTTGTDFPNAESLLDAIFAAGETSNFRSDWSASTASSLTTLAPAATATAAAAVASSSIAAYQSSAREASVVSQSVFASGTRTSSVVTGLTSLTSTQSWRDSGIFSFASSAASLPTISSGFLLPSINSSSPSLSPSLESASLLPESQASVPVKSLASAVSAISTMATIPEDGTGSPAKLKAKRRRNKKKNPLLTASMNKDSEQEPSRNRRTDEEATEKEAGKGAQRAREKEAETTAGARADDESLRYLEENRQLREARTCKVCMDSEVNTVFLPCGHLVCCNNCSPQLRNCPICRTFIRGTVKTSIS